jgi:hypothetical protein
MMAKYWTINTDVADFLGFLFICLGLAVCSIIAIVSAFNGAWLKAISFCD